MLFCLMIKIVREHINEKFEEDSDPIKDMGIGIFKTTQNFKTEEEFYEYLLIVIPLILGTKTIPSNFIVDQPGKLIRYDYYLKIRDYLDKYKIRCKDRPVNSSRSSVYWWTRWLNKYFKEHES